MYDAADLAPKPDAAAERIAIARKLAELGLRLAGRLVEDVEAGACRAADPALAFSRLSRAVRLTLALEEKLEQGGLVKQKPQPAFSRLRGVILKDEACHRVRQMIELEAEDAAERGEPCDAERLHAGLDERMDETHDLEDFALLPLHVTVRRLCDDLGVPFDEDLWEDLSLHDVLNYPDNHDPPPITAHPRAGGDPGFLSNGAADQEKSPGPRRRGDERGMDSLPPEGEGPGWGCGP